MAGASLVPCEARGQAREQEQSFEGRHLPAPCRALPSSRKRALPPAGPQIVLPFIGWQQSRPLPLLGHRSLASDSREAAAQQQVGWIADLGRLAASPAVAERLHRPLASPSLLPPSWPPAQRLHAPRPPRQGAAAAMDRLQRMLGAGGMGGGAGAGDAPQQDTSEQIYISSLALLKMLKHGRAGVPLEVRQRGNGTPRALRRPLPLPFGGPMPSSCHGGGSDCPVPFVNLRTAAGHGPHAGRVCGRVHRQGGACSVAFAS